MMRIVSMERGFCSFSIMIFLAVRLMTPEVMMAYSNSTAC